ncbi:MAG: prepilin-type N-terminal cleavage/methylation domain-containing protein [Gemmatimonadota bacterium]|nr:MAG: prepilin-type N-terminal cleavage/methylation domain-containing protein [Gemmatimonadota bacterium]
MKRNDRSGFTFVEIMTALALLAVLTVIAWGKFSKSYDKALRATMMSDLRNLATAQEIYYREHLTYADDVSLVTESMTPSPKSTIVITDAHTRGWAAYNQMDATDERCELYVGRDVSSPLGYAGAAERIACDTP